jgi:L-lactate dehydrogenase complex protein LldG
MNETGSRAGQRNVLDEVRRALGRSETVKPAPLAAFVEEVEPESLQERLARFREETAAVGAHFHEARTAEEAGARIAEICKGSGFGEVALSGAPVLEEMYLATQLVAHDIATFAAMQYQPEEKAKLVMRLANCRAGITAVDYAIAETGTLALTSDEDQALLISLLPPVHIALLRPQQIIATLGEAVSRIGEERIRRADATRSTTFITGPSRTSDVELTLSIGVHGPKELHLILLTE